MYISKVKYNFLKVICVIGLNLWGFLCVIMLIGLGIDISKSRFGVFQTDIPSILCAFAAIYGMHFFVGIWLEKVKVYHGFFANDADGILQPKVIARALGMEERKVVSEIQILCRWHLFKNCSIQYNGFENVIVLSEAKTAGLGYEQQFRVVVCPHCGGENHIRPGFVQSCQFCSGKID